MPSQIHGLSRKGVSRRAFMIGAISSSGALAACTTAPTRLLLPPEPLAPDPAFVAMYSALPNERFPIPAVDVSAINPIYFRQRVRYESIEPAGTIVVDPGSFFLYLVTDPGWALRYGVGVGRQGFGWAGEAIISRKAEWPTWTPPASMIERDPSLAPYARGMAPGLDNPLGARALYLYEDGQDTLYRIHGTNEPRSIGNAVSSGCIRLFNQDIIDLYGRTPRNARVVVIPHGDVTEGLLHDH